MRLALLALCVAAPLAAQQHTHDAAHNPVPAGGTPSLPGQDAYGAIAEIVRLLEADPATDWSRVNLEALRAHLIDMNEVTLDAAVRATPVEGGLQMDVTGDAAVAASIRRMLTEHTRVLDAMPEYGAVAVP